MAVYVELFPLGGSFGPSFGLDAVPMLNRPLGGYPAWQYAATVMWVLAALVLSWLVGWFARGRLGALAAKTASRADDEIIRHMAGPVRTAVFTAVVYYGLPMFDWPPPVTKLIQVLVIVLVAVSLTYAVLKMVDVGFRLLELRCERERFLASREMFPAFRKIAKTIIVIVGILLFCENIGIDIKTALAGLGIGGLALALAAQDILANFFSSLVIIIDSPYRIGDRIKVKAHSGLVESIGLRSTRLRTEEGNLITIPNKTMAAEDITRLSRERAGT